MFLVVYYELFSVAQGLNGNIHTFREVRYV